MSVINLGAWFGWRGSADTDLRFNEFFAADHTVMARFMPQYPIASAGPILAENGSGTYFVGQGNFSSNPAGTKLMLSVGNQSQVYPSTLVTAGTWLHVAVVRSGNTFKLYLNGTHLTPDVTIGANEPNLPGGTSTLRMGRRTDNVTVSGIEAQYYGFVDDVAVFTKALTKQEIRQVINEADGRLHANQTGLLAAWIFDKALPSGAALPAKFKRPLTFNSIPAHYRANLALLSEKRDSAFDAKILPLPYMEVEWRLPFKTGQPWKVIWGNSTPDSSHNGPYAFCWDFMLRGSNTAGCGEPLYAVANGTLLDFLDTDGGFDDGEPLIDGQNFLHLEMAAGEIALYLHTLTGSIRAALGPVTPPVAIAKGALVAKVGTLTQNNCHLHISCTNLTTKEHVTFPVCFSNYEVCNVQDGVDPGNEHNWHKIDRGIPQQGQWVRRT